jgi:hypothetical protein
MTHDELLAEIDELDRSSSVVGIAVSALRAVVELHKPQEITLPNGEWGANCIICDGWSYPCPTIQAIEKELQVKEQKENG